MANEIQEIVIFHTVTTVNIEYRKREAVKKTKEFEPVIVGLLLLNSKNPVTDFLV